MPPRPGLGAAPLPRPVVFLPMGSLSPPHTVTIETPPYLSIKKKKDFK